MSTTVTLSIAGTESERYQITFTKLGDRLSVDLKHRTPDALEPAWEVYTLRNARAEEGVLTAEQPVLFGEVTLSIWLDLPPQIPALHIEISHSFLFSGRTIYPISADEVFAMWTFIERFDRTNK